MKLFKGKKVNPCCDKSLNQETLQKAIQKQSTGSRIKILGSGCAKCKTLEEHVAEALTQLGIQENCDHITDFAEIASYGVMTTPALVIDEKVVVYGKVPTDKEILALLKQAGY